MEYTGKYYFYSYINTNIHNVFGLETKVKIKHCNDVCCNCHPFLICDNYSVNDDTRTLISYQEITEEEYRNFGEIITKKWT